MANSPYTELYKKLNPAQKEAVDTIEGPVMVVAGPGTGKTQILTLRIANILIQSQVNPENILAMTFTEAAAMQMRRRLAEIIGTPAYKVEINTFHGFCNDIIQSNPEDFPELLSSESITDVEQIQLMEQLIQETSLKLLKPFGDPLYYVRPALMAINDLKKEGVTPQEFEKAIKIQEEDFGKIDDLYHEKGKYKGEMKGKYQDLQKSIEKNKELLILFKAYEQQLRQERKYDFNDMLLFTKKALENNKSLLMRLQEQFQYILVDEHQDTNSAQNKIIELLANFYDEPNLFVVGDEKQAIFRFQGASLENFLYFRKLYPTAKLINLTKNYRSHQWILDASDSLISKNIAAQLLLPEKVRLLSESPWEKEKIKLAILNDYHAEFEFVAEQIKQKQKEGVPLSEIAVLGRRNKDLQEMAGFLERKGIPFAINSDANILDDLEIQKFLLILRAINSFGTDQDLLRVMHVSFLDIDPLDIYKIIRYSQEKEISVSDVLARVGSKKQQDLALENTAAVKNLYKNLQIWKKESENVSFGELFVSVIRRSGFREQILKHPRRFELLDKLITLYELVKFKVSKNPDFSLKDFIDYLELLQSHGLGIEVSAKSSQKEAVNLMTAHRSKGLEFDYVYILNVFDSRWGNSKMRSAGFTIPWDILGVKLNVELDENEDERRLFYVAMTRARKGVMLSFSTRSLEGKEQLPSQFIDEVDPQFYENISTEEFEQLFLQEKDRLFDRDFQVEPPFKDQEFFAKLFAQRGLSPTALENFMTCPWRYFYLDLLHFPELKSGALVFGSAIHASLDAYIKQIATQPFLSDEQACEFLLDEFEKRLKKEPISAQEKQILMEKGKFILENYYQAFLKNYSGQILSEVSVRGVKLADDIVLNGRIDMLEKGSKNGEVIVHDFKTGKPKSRNVIEGKTASSDGAYKRQLVFYKLLLDHYQGGRMKMSEGVLDFVEPDARGKFHSERFVIEDPEVKVLEDQIRYTAEQIKSLSFWNDRCGDKDCEYCKLREMTIKE